MTTGTTTTNIMRTIELIWVVMVIWYGDDAFEFQQLDPLAPDLHPSIASSCLALARSKMYLWLATQSYPFSDG